MKGIVCPRCRNLINKVEVGSFGVRVDYPDVTPAEDGSGYFNVACTFLSCGHKVTLERTGEVAYDAWPYRVVTETV